MPLELVASTPDQAAAFAEATKTTTVDETEKISQASALVAFVEEHADLFHDQNGEVYAETKDVRETRRLDSRQFKDWLVAHFYKKSGKSARDQSTREALSTLAGLGRYRGECRDVYIRVALQGTAYYLDLGEAGKNRAVKVTAGRWEIVENPPVRFIRPETLRPLPEPRRGGVICVFQTNLDTDSTRSWTVIPRQAGHRFQSKLDSQP